MARQEPPTGGRGPKAAHRILAACGIAAAAMVAAPAASFASQPPALGVYAAPFPDTTDPPLMRSAGIRRSRFDLNWSFNQPAAPAASSAATKTLSIVPECSDFADNDGDGLVDGADPGCTSPFDNSEQDSPPPPPGGQKYQWGYSDLEIQRLAQSGIRSLPILLGTPAWLAKQPLMPPTSSPEALQAWTAFLDAAVHRYGPGGAFWSAHPELPYLPIRAWQIWNEPNYPASWVPDPSPSAYAQLLRVSEQTIHGVDPGARIVLAGLGPGTAHGGRVRAADYLNRLYSEGAKRHFDVAAVHAYSTNARGDERQIRRLAGVMRAHGDASTPLWVTEFGWSSSAAPGRHWSAASTARQARLMRRVLRWATAGARPQNLRALYWFEWRDIPNPNGSGPDFDFGLRHSDGRAKPSWKVFRRFATRN